MPGLNQQTADLGRETVSLEELAEALGRTPAGMNRAWRRLHSDFGLPLPIRGSNLRWPREAVRAWLRCGGSCEGVLPYGAKTRGGFPVRETAGQARAGGKGIPATSANDNPAAAAADAGDLIAEQNLGLRRIYGANQ